jgi:hypothetical protein
MARAAAPKPPSEYDFHRSVVHYLNRAVNAHDVIYFHPANGGYRFATEAARLKLMGVVAGMPDLGLIHNGRCCWLELKARKGRITAAQAYCHQRLMEAGSPVSVCKTLEDVEAALVRAGIPIKARLS